MLSYRPLLLPLVLGGVAGDSQGKYSTDLVFTHVAQAGRTLVHKLGRESTVARPKS